MGPAGGLLFYPEEIMTAATFTLPEIRPDWMQEAACRGHDPSLWYPELGETEKRNEALRICTSCPVKKECLDWAFEVDDRWAILGNKTPKQRTRIRQRMDKLGRWLPSYIMPNTHGQERNAGSRSSK